MQCLLEELQGLPAASLFADKLIWFVAFERDVIWYSIVKLDINF